MEQTPEIVVSSADDIRLAAMARTALAKQISVPEATAASTHANDPDRERFFSSELVNGDQQLRPDQPRNHLGGVPAHSWSVMPQGSAAQARSAAGSTANAVANFRRRGTSECHHTAFGHGAAVLNRKDIFYRGSVTQLPEYKSNPQIYRSQTSLHRPPSITHDGAAPDYYHEAPAAARMSVESGPSPTPAPSSGLKEIWNDLKDTMKQMVDIRILADPLFIVFAISNFLTSVGMTPPLVFLPDRAAHMGMENDDFLLSIYGIFNTIGRLAIGWMSDQKWANRLLIYNVSLSIGGVGTILSFLCKTFGWLSFYAGFYGASLSESCQSEIPMPFSKHTFVSGAYISLTSVILVDLVGLDLLTNAFGLMLLFQGVASLIGAPIAGKFGLHTYLFELVQVTSDFRHYCRRYGKL